MEKSEEISRCVENVFQDIYESLQFCANSFICNFDLEIDFKDYQFDEAMYDKALFKIKEKLDEDNCPYFITENKDNLEANLIIPIITLNEEQEAVWKKYNDKYDKVLNKEGEMIECNTIGIVIVSFFASILIVSKGPLVAVAIIAMIIIVSVLGFRNGYLNLQEKNIMKELFDYYKKQNVKILVPPKYYNGQLVKKNFSKKKKFFQKAY